MEEIAKKNGLLYSADFKTVLGVDESSNEFTGKVPAGAQRIGEEAFSCCNLTFIDIPDSVTEIGANAFCNCPNLERVHLPVHLEDFPPYLFYCCSSLKEIPFRGGIKVLPECVAYGCSSVTTIVLPVSVEKICTNAFSNCENLRAIVLSANLKEVEPDIVVDCPNLSHIRVPEENTYFRTDEACTVLYRVNDDGTETPVFEVPKKAEANLPGYNELPEGVNPSIIDYDNCDSDDEDEYGLEATEEEKAVVNQDEVLPENEAKETSAEENDGTAPAEIQPSQTGENEGIQADETAATAEMPEGEAEKTEEQVEVSISDAQLDSESAIDSLLSSIMGQSKMYDDGDFSINDIPEASEDEKNSSVLASSHSSGEVSLEEALAQFNGTSVEEESAAASEQTAAAEEDNQASTGDDITGSENNDAFSQPDASEQTAAAEETAEEGDSTAADDNQAAESNETDAADSSSESEAVMENIMSDAVEQPAETDAVSAGEQSLEAALDSFEAAPAEEAVSGEGTVSGEQSGTETPSDISEQSETENTSAEPDMTFAVDNGGEEINMESENPVTGSENTEAPADDGFNFDFPVENSVEDRLAEIMAQGQMFGNEIFTINDIPEASESEIQQSCLEHKSDEPMDFTEATMKVTVGQAADEATMEDRLNQIMAQDKEQSEFSILDIPAATEEELNADRILSSEEAVTPSSAAESIAEEPEFADIENVISEATIAQSQENSSDSRNFMQNLAFESAKVEQKNTEVQAEVKKNLYVFAEKLEDTELGPKFSRGLVDLCNRLALIHGFTTVYYFKGTRIDNEKFRTQLSEFMVDKDVVYAAKADYISGLDESALDFVACLGISVDRESMENQDKCAKTASGNKLKLLVRD